MRWRPWMIPVVIVAVLEGGAQLLNPGNPRIGAGRDVFQAVGGLDLE